MPNGRVMRIDEERQCAYVVRSGRSYEAPLSEVERAARVPGARVRYRLRRSDGIEQAEQVTLRTGTRTNKRQRRFGDLTGARQPGTNVPTSGQKAYGIDVATQPFRVAEAWLSAMSEHDFDAATSLYLPGAALDIAGESNVGRGRIRSGLEASSWAGVNLDRIEIHGSDRYVRADRFDLDEGDQTYFTIGYGQIIEQWIDSEPEQDAPEASTPTRQILTKGEVSTADHAYAEKRLDHLIESQSPTPSFVRMKLDQTSNRSGDTPARAEITLDVDGSVVRAHAAAMTMTEGIDLVVKRVQKNLGRRHTRNLRQPTTPTDGSWRHDYLPAIRTGHFERPPEEREIVRHKSFAADETSVDEAAWDMSLLDYDFFLFVELSTGKDCLLERRDQGELHLHVLHQDGDPPPPTLDDVPTVQEPTPTLRPSEAIQLLDGADWPFLFFLNPTTGRGNVIYRRYDGHYGLITPPAEIDEYDEGDTR